MAGMALPTVSIIIPVKPGGEVRALDGLAALDYPDDLVEVIVAEGRRPSQQRNSAAEAAVGEILYFLDDDSMVEPDLLRRAVPHYADPRVAAVGGPSLTPETDTILQKAFGEAFASPFGGGSVRNRYRQTGTARETRDNELILCNLSFRREVFLSSVGLDNRLYPNEENELMDRLSHMGWRLIHDPSLAVRRSQRPCYSAFVRQLFTYGWGRWDQTRISGRINLACLAPPFLLIYLLLLPLLVLHNPVYTLPLLCYAVLVFTGAALGVRHSGRAVMLPLLLLILPTLHLAYGAGMIRGLLLPRSLKEVPVPTEVTLTKVKREPRN